MPIGGTKAIRIVAPAAAAQDHQVRPVGEPAGGPFPHVAGHVEEAGRRTPLRKAADRRGAQISVGGIGRAAADGAEIGMRAWLFGRHVAPWEPPAVGAARGELPFPLARQAQAVEAAECGGIWAETCTTGWPPRPAIVLSGPKG